MAFKFANPEGTGERISKVNAEFRDKAPTVATVSGSTQREDALNGQGPNGEFARASGDPEAADYFNGYVGALDHFLTKNGDIPPPAEDTGMREDEEEALA